MSQKPTPSFTLFQLLQWKAAVKLEAKGMKHSSGRSVRAHVCRVFGLRPRLPHAQVITFLEQVKARAEGDAYKERVFPTKWVEP